MSHPATGPQAHGGYDIRLKGHLDARWTAWFDGLTLTHAADGSTVIHGPALDQAGLYGVLLKLRDVGLPLVSVTQAGAVADSACPASPTSSPR